MKPDSLRPTPLCFVALLLACGGEERIEPADAPGSGGAETAQAVAPAPDTTGAAIWAHIQGEAYRDNWELWPDLGEFYEGTEPHGILLTTYVNGIALEALNSGEVVMPAGAVIVKENYMPDRQLAAITVMYKQPGYNPDYADWFFTKHLPDGTLDVTPNGMAMEGRLPGCQACHLARQDMDFLYTPRPGMGEGGS